MKYIYIMRKKHGGIFAPLDFLFQNCKIGVSTHPELRLMQVNETTKGKVVLSSKYPMIWGAYVKESLLHKLFSLVRHTEKPERGHKSASGGTEWFYLTIVGRIAVEMLLFLFTFDFVIAALLLAYFATA